MVIAYSARLAGLPPTWFTESPQGGTFITLIRQAQCSTLRTHKIRASNRLSFNADDTEASLRLDESVGKAPVGMWWPDWAHHAETRFRWLGYGTPKWWQVTARASLNGGRFFRFFDAVSSSRMTLASPSSLPHS